MEVKDWCLYNTLTRSDIGDNQLHGTIQKEITFVTSRDIFKPKNKGIAAPTRVRRPVEMRTRQVLRIVSRRCFSTVNSGGVVT
jgi:hypothetical protein